jgi:hypothetical protein
VEADAVWVKNAEMKDPGTCRFRGTIKVWEISQDITSLLDFFGI